MGLIDWLENRLRGYEDFDEDRLYALAEDIDARIRRMKRERDREFADAYERAAE